MPNELILPPGTKSGLTVTAEVYDQTGTQVGATVSLSEVGSTSIYRGDMPTASQGVYFVEFKDSFNNHLGTYEMNWTGSAEVTVFDTSSALVDVESKIDILDSNVDAVLVDTGTTIPAQISGVSGNVDAVLADTGTNIPAQISGVSGNVDAVLVDTGTTIPNQISGVSGNLDAVLVDTGTTIPAQISGVSGNVDTLLVDTGTNIPTQISGVAGDVMSSVVESDVDLLKTLKIMLSVLSGKVQGSGDDTFRTEVFRSVTDDRDVLTSKTNADGERVEIQIHG